MARRPWTAATFVEAVHRRLIFLRLLEQLGRGVLIGAILAIVLIAGAIWQSMPTLPILVFCGMFALLIGGALAVYRWPSRSTTAAEADRQLGMDDLLTTALFSNSAVADGFFNAVTAMADARCASHSPSEVALVRLGIRNWSAIVLAMGIAITLAAIPLSSTPSQATDANSAILSADSALQQSRGPLAIVNDPMSELSSNGSMSVESKTPQDFSGSNPSPADHRAGDAGGDHGGGATTGAKSATAPQPAVAGGGPQNANGHVAGGGNGSNLLDQRGESSGNKTTSGSASANSVSAWSGRSPAGLMPDTTSNDNEIPPEDRDLVHDFFNH